MNTSVSCSTRCATTANERKVMSKGSKQRPGKGYEDNFSRIFGERKRERYVPPPVPQPKEKK